MDKENTFGDKVCQAVGNILVGCISVCLAACAIALTVRFIMWLF
jgi:hypothetical protein